MGRLDTTFLVKDPCGLAQIPDLAPEKSRKVHNSLSRLARRSFDSVKFLSNRVVFSCDHRFEKLKSESVFLFDFLHFLRVFDHFEC